MGEKRMMKRSNIGLERKGARERWRQEEEEEEEEEEEMRR